jgi:hypothetical protein
MRQQYKLIYVGILKFGFKNESGVSILGLLDFITSNNMKLEQEPVVSVNREYCGEDDYFWDLEWWNGDKCLVVFFDKSGCQYQTITCTEDVVDSGDIDSYSDFTKLFRWLSGS